MSKLLLVLAFYIVSVSYTHLDVYKRQVVVLSLLCELFRFCNLFLLVLYAIFISVF